MISFIRITIVLDDGAKRTFLDTFRPGCDDKKTFPRMDANVDSNTNRKLKWATTRQLKFDMQLCL